MAAETLAFADGCDNVYPIKHDLERLIGYSIPVIMFIDSKLFDALTRSRYASERRLLIGIAASRVAYLDETISKVGLILSDHNPADRLTKLESNNVLKKLLLTHSIDHPVEQYIIHQAQDGRDIQA